MAAMLAEIKSHLLLPKPNQIAEEDDPRAELIRRLQAYEIYKKAGERLDALPRMDRDLFSITATPPPEAKPVRRWSEVSIEELVAAARDALTRAEFRGHHHISREPLSVRERMTQVLERISARVSVSFVALLELDEGRAGIVVTLLAVLELLRGQMIEIVQREAYGPIFLKTSGDDATCDIEAGPLSDV
jgi:segregation and condensation protein A